MINPTIIEVPESRAGAKAIIASFGDQDIIRVIDNEFIFVMNIATGETKSYARVDGDLYVNPPKHCMSEF